MSRLIDADALIEQMEADAEQMEEPVFIMATYAAINNVKHQPTIEERKTGKWIEKDVTCIDDELDDRNVIDEWQAAKCSVCGKWHTTPYLYSFDNYAYCPNCGAWMHGGKQDETA